jgi:hypothetical protein
VGRRLRQRAIDLLAHPTVRSEGSRDGKTIVVMPAGWTQRDIAQIARTASELTSFAAGVAAEDRRDRSDAEKDIGSLREHFGQVEKQGPEGEGGGQ